MRKSIVPVLLLLIVHGAFGDVEFWSKTAGNREFTATWKDPTFTDDQGVRWVRDSVTISAGSDSGGTDARLVIDVNDSGNRLNTGKSSGRLSGTRTWTNLTEGNVKVDIDWYRYDLFDTVHGSVTKSFFSSDQTAPTFVAAFSTSVSTSGPLTQTVNVSLNSIADKAGTINGSGTATLEYAVDGGSWKVPSHSVDLGGFIPPIIVPDYLPGMTSFSLPPITMTNFGSHTVSVRITDQVGNQAVQTLVIPFKAGAVTEAPSIVYDDTTKQDVVTLPLRFRAANLIGLSKLTFTRLGADLPSALRGQEISIPLLSDGTPNPASLPAGVSMATNTDDTFVFGEKVPISLGAGTHAVSYRWNAVAGTESFTIGDSSSAVFPAHGVSLKLWRQDGSELTSYSLSGTDGISVEPSWVDLLSGTIKIWTVEGDTPSDLSAVPPTTSQTAELSLSANGKLTLSNYLTWNTLGQGDGLRTVVVRMTSGANTWFAAKTFEKKTSSDATMVDTLSHDESWSGELELTGKVYVPNGVNLTITSDVKLYSQQPSYAIVVQAGGHVFVTPGASVAENAWAGFQVQGGTLTVDSAGIRNAARGIVVSGATSQVTLLNATVSNNEIGLHLVGDASQVKIRHSTFQNNGFAFKEDSGAAGLVTFQKTAAAANVTVNSDGTWLIGDTTLTGNARVYYALRRTDAVRLGVLTQTELPNQIAMEILP